MFYISYAGKLGKKNLKLFQKASMKEMCLLLLSGSVFTT